MTFVNTARVVDRRVVRYASVEGLFEDVDALVAAQWAGALAAKGNWSLGQALGHVAAWAEFAHEGYPPAMQSPPWIVRLLARFWKRGFIRGAMRPGLKLHGVAGGTLATDDAPAEEAAARLRRAFTRLQATAPTRPNPLFGPLTHEEWLGLNLRHAELHLSFFEPRGGANGGSDATTSGEGRGIRNISSVSTIAAGSGEA